jgi:Peptidase family M28
MKHFRMRLARTRRRDGWFERNGSRTFTFNIIVARRSSSGRAFCFAGRANIQTMSRKGKICAAASLLAAGMLYAATDWSMAGKAWWKNVEYLASDSLEGRNVASAGYDKAAAYVASQFDAAGLQPAGTEKYFQPVDFTETSLNAAQSSVALVRDGHASAVDVPGEAQLGYSPHSAHDIEAPVVFAGYGLVIPEAHYDDLKGLPVKGAIVAFLTGGPESIDGNIRSHYSSAEERWKALHHAGAAGIISIPNPKTMEIPWSRQMATWGRPRMSLADPSLSKTEGLLFSASWNPDKADDLLRGSGHDFSQIVNAATSNQPLPHFALMAKINAKVSTSERRVASKNVAAMRPGSDPKLKNQVVVISAHLDHLGVGKAVDGDSIYNGAMDDASGVASVIEIAKSLGRKRMALVRSILFLTVTGEEKGELGSEYFAGHPTAKGPIVADINMDMFLPLFPLKWLEVQGLNESSLGDDIRDVASTAGVKVQADKEPNRNRFIRSDQYSFIKKGVPSLAFKFGFVPGGEEDKIFKAWYRDRYHGLKDDLSQPVDVEAAAQFNAILENLAVKVANAPQAPAWKPASFFRRFLAARK